MAREVSSGMRSIPFLPGAGTIVPVAGACEHCPFVCRGAGSTLNRYCLIMTLANATDRETTGELRTDSDKRSDKTRGIAQGSDDAHERSDKKRKVTHGPDNAHVREPYLTSDVRKFFGHPIRGPDDAIAAEPWLLEAVKRLAGEHTTTPSKSPIILSRLQKQPKRTRPHLHHLILTWAG